MIAVPILLYGSVLHLGIDFGFSGRAVGGALRWSGIPSGAAMLELLVFPINWLKENVSGQIQFVFHLISFIL